MIFYEEILHQFDKEDVKYVLVGGIAFNLLGGFRNTFDMDILVDFKSENLLKIVKILKKQGYHVKQPVNPEDIANEDKRRIWIDEKNMKAFNFYKDEKTFEEVDIIIDSPVTYEDAIEDANIINIKGLKLYVISIDNLIKMKSVTGREKDNLDIKDLLKIKEFSNEK